jgi:catechol-2,3-dioxygenase
MPTPPAPRGSLHHVELRVNDLGATAELWEWLLTELGYQQFQAWSGGVSWKLADTYLVLEQTHGAVGHDRRQVGLSHLAFHAGDRSDVDRLWKEAPTHGWVRLYEDRHPWAGGEPGTGSAGHYAAFFENDERFKVEIVAAGA